MRRITIFLLVFTLGWPADVSARRRKKRLSAAAKRKAARAKARAKAKAKKLFAKGKNLFAQNKFKQAVKVFKQAYDLWQHRVILFNIALSYTAMKKRVQAAKYIRLYLREAKGQERVLPPVLRKIYDSVGVLSINTPDPNAEIFIDGRPVGKGKVQAYLKVGKRAVDIRLGERIVARRTIEVGPREERVWDLKEIPKPPPEPRVARPRPGYTPSARGGGGGTPTVSARAKSKGGIHWGYFTGLAILAAAAGGAAVGMDMLTRKTYDDYDADPYNDSLRKKGLMYRNLTIGALSVCAAAAVTATVLVFFTRWKKKEKSGPAVSISPIIGPGSAGLNVTLQH